MRTTKELLELMLAHQNYFRAGLCLWADNIWLNKLISDDEYIALRYYIELNKPDEMFDKNYFWEAGSIAPRIGWIILQTKKLEAIRLIEDLYKTNDGGAGGYGHVVFDDGNVKKRNIKSGIKNAEENKYKNNLSEETRLASIKALEYFLKLTEEERREVYDRFWS